MVGLGRLHVLVLAGGSGTRFWPQSRRSVPKQFLPLAGEDSLLAETVARVDGLVPVDNVWVLTRQDLADGVAERVPSLRRDRIIAEPEARDTAPCLVLAAARIAQVDPDALLLILPADHMITDGAQFCRCIEGAVASLDEIDGLLTFGVDPTYPATGYGYVQRRDEDGIAAGATRCYGVDGFREKPPEDVAKQYLADGRYLWNAGIFLWQLQTFRAALERCAPELWQGWQRLHELGAALADPSQPEVATRIQELPRISIDYALMERADNVRVVVADFPWDDIGSWSAVDRYHPHDANGNVTRGRVALTEGRDNTVLATGDRVVAVLGVDGLVVVDTPDALLICPRDKAEEVKKLVDQLQERGWDEVL
ncbi:MAG: mannose-1-phosphate guanylyltransferase [Planctomycetota bacterium]